jgi:hypothetical protein
VKESSQRLKESSRHVKEPSHDVKESSQHVMESSHDVQPSPHDVKESSQRLKESSQRLKESSERRFHLKLARSGAKEALEGLLHLRQEGLARAPGQLASSFRLKSPVSRAREHGFGRKYDVEQLLEDGFEGKPVVRENGEHGEWSLDPL